MIQNILIFLLLLAIECPFPFLELPFFESQSFHSKHIFPHTTGLLWDELYIMCLMFIMN